MLGRARRDREPRPEPLADHPQPVVRPNAWRDFGKELVAILPPLTLFNVARIPGALLPNLAMLGFVIVAGYGLYWLTGTGPQWAAYGLGVYAIFSWIQSLKHRDPPAYALIWGSPIVVLLAISFGSISFVTYATSFWIPFYVEGHFYGDGMAPARYVAGLTAKSEIGLIIGWSAAFSAAQQEKDLAQTEKIGGYVSAAFKAASAVASVF